VISPAPESRKTLTLQQQQLRNGDRRVQMFPKGHIELPLPKGMSRIKVPKGDVFHFDPKRVKASEIVKASKAGRENELLDLGPVSKDEAMARAASGERPVAVVERDKNGTEARAAAGTEGTAHKQVAALEGASSRGHTVSVENPDDTVARRFADGGDVDGPWADFPEGDAPWDETPAAAPQEKAADISTPAAAFEGFKKGLSANFSDEIYGASQASGLPEWLGGFRAPVGAARLGYEYVTGEPGSATDSYNKGVEYARARQAEAEKQHPTAMMLGEVGGAGLGTLAVPIGSAATLPGRIAQGAAVGAGYGALSGAGEGTDLATRGTGAGIGAITGGLTGAAVPPVVEGAIQGTRALTRPIANSIRGAIDPEAEASRRVATALARDYSQTGPSLGAEEIAAANLAGTPRGLVDAGGETTRALARSAANTSPEARQALTQFTSGRFATQNDRAASVIQSVTGATGDNAGMIESLKAAARKTNKPAYEQAYNAGDKEIWSPELERLSSAPSVQQALKSAATKWRDWQVHDGFGSSNPPVMVKNGIIDFGNGRGLSVFPNLQFWDYAARNIADRAEQARRSGAMQEAARLGGLEKQLKTELDKIVPEYNAARSGAARAFGAQDAVEAGGNFVTSKMDNDSARRALQKMSPPEKQLFSQGYASGLISKIREIGDRRSILNSISQSPAERERMEIALGPQGASQVEAFLRAEGVLDRARGAISGNSTTARQLAELGLAGGAYGVTSGGDLTDPKALATGAIVWGLTHGNRKINEAVARRVGEMLVSDNPGVLKRGIKIAARNANIMDGLRRVDGFGVGMAAQPPATFAAKSTPAIQLPSMGSADENQNGVPRPPSQQDDGSVVTGPQGFAHGGRVEKQTLAESGSKGKIDRSAFLYLDGAEKAFAQCGTCAFGRERCAVMGRRKVSAKTGSCGFYIKGAPVNKLISELTPEQTGYVERQVRCENCRYFDNGCDLYRDLNSKFPDKFAMDPNVHKLGCCNANEPK
jgi:hypothetical protein